MRSLFIALFAILFLVIFNYTLTMMGSIYIVSELGGSKYMTTYTVSFFSIGNAIGVPLGRSLSSKIGTLPLLIICLLLFAFFSFACAIAVTYLLFIIARFLQGIVSGPFYTLTNRLFAQFTPPDKKDVFTSITLTIFTVGPVVGACLGGWIAYDYHWRWIFYLNIPIIVFLAFFVWWKLKGVMLPAPARIFDGVGYFFYCVALSTLGFAITTGQEFDWFRSSLITVPMIIGIVSFLFFVLWSLRHPDPILNFRLFKNIPFSFGLFNLAFLFSAYFGMVILLALWLSLYVNYTPIWIGVLIGNMALAGFFPTFLIMKKIGHIDCRIPLIIALLFLGYSSFHTSYFNVDINFERIAMSRVLAGFGLAFFLPPIFRLCFHSFPETLSIDIVVAFQFVRALSSGLGVALYTILWQRREIFYHERLGSALTITSPKTQQFLSDAKTFHLQGQKAFAQLDYLLEREAISLALDDCFYLMGWVMVALFVVLVFTFFYPKESFCPEKKLNALEKGTS